VNMLIAEWFTVNQTDLTTAESSGAGLISGRRVQHELLLLVSFHAFITLSARVPFGQMHYYI
jgi:hypothetical protein